MASSNRGGATATASSVWINGIIVRYFRKERELEIAELAKLAGVGESYIKKIELGHSQYVSLGVHRKLRTALGVGAADSRVLMACPFGIPDSKAGAA